VRRNSYVNYWQMFSETWLTVSGTKRCKRTMDRNLMADILEQVADFWKKANTERKYEWVLPHWQ